MAWKHEPKPSRATRFFLTGAEIANIPPVLKTPFGYDILNDKGVCHGTELYLLEGRRLVCRAFG